MIHLINRMLTVHLALAMLAFSFFLITESSTLSESQCTEVKSALNAEYILNEMDNKLGVFGGVQLTFADFIDYGIAFPTCNLIKTEYDVDGKISINFLSPPNNIIFTKCETKKANINKYFCPDFNEKFNSFYIQYKYITVSTPIMLLRVNNAVNVCTLDGCLKNELQGTEDIELPYQADDDTDAYIITNSKPINLLHSDYEEIKLTTTSCFYIKKCETELLEPESYVITALFYRTTKTTGKILGFELNGSQNTEIIKDEIEIADSTTVFSCFAFYSVMAKKIAIICGNNSIVLTITNDSQITPWKDSFISDFRLLADTTPYIGLNKKIINNMYLIEKEEKWYLGPLDFEETPGSDSGAYSDKVRFDDNQAINLSDNPDIGAQIRKWKSSFNVDADKQERLCSFPKVTINQDTNTKTSNYREFFIFYTCEKNNYLINKASDSEPTLFFFSVKYFIEEKKSIISNSTETRITIPDTEINFFLNEIKKEYISDSSDILTSCHKPKIISSGLVNTSKIVTVSVELFFVTNVVIRKSIVSIAYSLEELIALYPNIYETNPIDDVINKQRRISNLTSYANLGSFSELSDNEYILNVTSGLNSEFSTLSYVTKDITSGKTKCFIGSFLGDEKVISDSYDQSAVRIQSLNSLLRPYGEAGSLLTELCGESFRIYNYKEQLDKIKTLSIDSTAILPLFALTDSKLMEFDYDKSDDNLHEITLRTTATNMVYGDLQDYKKIIGMSNISNRNFTFILKNEDHTVTLYNYSNNSTIPIKKSLPYTLKEESNNNNYFSYPLGIIVSNNYIFANIVKDTGEEKVACFGIDFANTDAITDAKFLLAKIKHKSTNTDRLLFYKDNNQYTLSDLSCRAEGYMVKTSDLINAIAITGLVHEPFLYLITLIPNTNIIEINNVKCKYFLKIHKFELISETYEEKATTLIHVFGIEEINSENTKAGFTSNVIVLNDTKHKQTQIYSVDKLIKRAFSDSDSTGGYSELDLLELTEDSANKANSCWNKKFQLEPPSKIFGHHFVFDKTDQIYVYLILYIKSGQQCGEIYHPDLIEIEVSNLSIKQIPTEKFLFTREDYKLIEYNSDIDYSNQSYNASQYKECKYDCKAIMFKLWKKDNGSEIFKNVEAEITKRLEYKYRFLVNSSMFLTTKTNEYRYQTTRIHEIAPDDIIYQVNEVTYYTQLLKEQLISAEKEISLSNQENIKKENKISILSKKAEENLYVYIILSGVAGLLLIILIIVTVIYTTTLKKYKKLKVNILLEERARGNSGGDAYHVPSEPTSMIQSSIFSSSEVNISSPPPKSQRNQKQAKKVTQNKDQEKKKPISKITISNSTSGSKQINDKKSNSAIGLKVATVDPFAPNKKLPVTTDQLSFPQQKIQFNAVASRFTF